MKKFLSLMLVLALVLSMAACGGKAEKTASVDLGALYESYSQYLPDMFRPDEATMLDFLGIPVEDCANYQIAICAEGMRADEIWLIEAKDADALARLKTLAETRMTTKADERYVYPIDKFVMDDNLIEGAKKLISYYRQFPHIFVEEYFGIKLYDFQKILLQNLSLF